MKGIDQVYSDMLSGGEAQEEAQGTYRKIDAVTVVAAESSSVN